MPGLVAVTGATGFIGSNLLPGLVAAGYSVRALTRQPRNDTNNLHWITGTLDDVPALEQLVSGAEAIIHCAGRVRGASLDEFLHTNLTGTVNLVQVVNNTGSRAPRFLLVSSLAAREPQLSWYADSKARAEHYLIENAAALPWTIFRPTAVYGPGDREMAPLFAATRLGLLPLTGGRAARFGLLYVEDFVEAVLCWLKAKNPAAGLYELDDGTPGGYDHDTVKDIASRVWGRPVFSVPVPGALIAAVATVNLRLSAVLGYSPMLTPGKVRELQHSNWVCDNRPLTEAFGWTPQTRLPEGLPRALAPAK